MKHLVQTLKWVLAVRGIVIILFGLSVLFIPTLNTQILTLMFGITVLVDGFVNAVGSVQSRKDVTDWWVYLLEGVFSILLGSITIFWPNISGSALLVIISVWAIVTGTAKMVAAIGLRKLIEGELILLFSGILSVIFGFTMLTLNHATAILFVTIIGFHGVLLGILLLSLTWRIRQEHDTRGGDFLAPTKDTPKTVQKTESSETLVSTVTKKAVPKKVVSTTPKKITTPAKSVKTKSSTKK